MEEKETYVRLRNSEEGVQGKKEELTVEELIDR